ncbi:hypothetical protein D3C85_993790 [compost metagenome]
MYETADGLAMTMEVFRKRYGSEIKENQTSENMRVLFTPIEIGDDEVYLESALISAHDVDGSLMNS